ncbi:MAG: ABC transporter substrate-binding protein [Spirochaetia bacterium]
MKPRKLFILLTVSCLLFTANLWANGGQEEETGPVEVRISGFGGIDQNIVEELLSNFVTPVIEDEGISVVYEPVPENYEQNLINSLSAGTAADLFYMDIFWARNVINTGRVAALNDYIDDSDIINDGDIIPSLLDAFTIDGDVYGIPKDFNSLALFFNKDIFDIAGVEYPDNDDTWEELEEKLAQVMENTEDMHGLAVPPDYARMGAFSFANGWQPFENGETNLMDPAFVESFEWYTSLKENGTGVVPNDIGQGWGGGAFAQGNVAACLEGAWILGFLRDNAPNLNYGAVMLPQSPNTGERGNFIFTVAWGINAGSANTEEAFRVVELLTSPEAQQWVLERGLAIPSRAALSDNEYFDQDNPEAQANKIVFMGASEGNVLPYFFHEYGGTWMEPINSALNEVFSGQTEVNSALETAQQRLERDVMD